MTGTPTAAVERWIFLHGFSQTHQSWWPVVAELTARLTARGDPAPALRLVDLPGHGLSPPSHKSIASTGAEVAETIDTNRSVLVGYSLGARIAIAAALRLAHESASGSPTGSGALRAMVLIGGTAGIELDSVRAHRVTTDAERAERIEADGVAAFLEDWVRLDLFGGYSPGDLDYRRRNSARGLAASLRYQGTGTQVPLWESLEAIDVPTLLIAGEHDHKFVDLGQRLQRRLPDATFVAIAGAHHAAHLQRPDEFAEVTVRWLDALT